MSLICPICFWEDDAFIGNSLDERSMCNKMTLRQARKNFLEIGACDAEMLDHVIPKEDRENYDFKPLET